MTYRPCALVVDGGAALEEDIDNGLAVVPIRVRIGSEDFVDDGRVSRYPGFYEELRAGRPTATSTPAPGEYLEAFKRCDADAIICLTIPAHWSGMYDAAMLATSMLEEEEGRRRVTVVDTGTAAGGLALVARLAASLCAERCSFDEVSAKLARACTDVRMYGALATLTYVARSGRVPALVAGISNSLHVRPVFRLYGGETGRVALTRTTSGAIQALQRVAVEHLNGDPQWLLIFHADGEREAAALSASLGATMRVARQETVQLSPVSGAYTGPGTIGFAAIPV
jgi:fatty acid kinase fatty acid binding subunit